MSDRSSNMNCDKLPDGVDTIKVIDETLDNKVIKFMWDHFFPDEPISRSLQITTPNWFVSEFYLREMLKDRSSVVALDSHGNVLAVRLARVIRKDDWYVWLLETTLWFLVSYFSFLLPKRVATVLGTIFRLFEKLRYNVFDALKQYECDAMYECQGLCSARFHGIKGLGTALVLKSEKVAMQKGCTHAYVKVTGKYSYKIFDKLDYSLENTVLYDDFRDSNGELYLKDCREHTHCVTFVKKLQ